MMKLSITLPFFMFLLCSGFSQTEEEQLTIEILPESHLEISGNTNISTFTCVFDTSLISGKKKVFFEKKKSSLYFEHTSLILTNSGFDCGSRGINKDFHKLLKTKTYPEIQIGLAEVKFINKGLVEVEAIIKIADTSKNYHFPVEIKNDQNLQIIGRLKVNIADFALKPPRKLLGLISVKNDIEINFNLKIKSDAKEQ